MNLVLIGRGRMGSMLWELAEAAGHTALARVDVDDLDTLAALPRGDVALDFPAPRPGAGSRLCASHRDALSFRCNSLYSPGYGRPKRACGLCPHPL